MWYRLKDDFEVEYAKSPEVDLAKNLRYTLVYKKIIVSTVFLGLDHNFNDEGPPILFETMIFANPEEFPDLDGYQRRSSTYHDAIAIHRTVVKSVIKRFEKAAAIHGILTSLKLQNKPAVIYNIITALQESKNI